MKLALALVTTISWMGCGIDTAARAPGGDDGTGGAGDPGQPVGDPIPVPGTGPVTEVSGHITASATWSDTIDVVGAVTIDAGATVTVLPGTVVNVATGQGITVAGTLAIQGTKASKVTIQSATAGDYWAEIAVPRGVVTASYLVQTGGGLTIAAPGKVTIVDSHLSHVGGDLLIMSGGTLDMTYSEIGLDSGTRDTTHCAMHVSGAPIIKASHSNFTTASYGIMFYGGSAADFTYDNWLGNGIDVAGSGPPTSGNFSFSYFGKAAPSGAGITAAALATARIADAGVR